MPETARRFTLVELLVVISIIAVLAAILLPSLVRARAYAKEVICVSQQRQLMVLAALYETDHQYVLPSHYTKPNATAYYQQYHGPEMLVYGGYLGYEAVGRPDDWSLGPRSTASWVNGDGRSGSIYLCPAKTFYGKHGVRILGGGSLQAPTGGWTLAAREHSDGETIGSLPYTGKPWSGAWTVPVSYAIVYTQKRDANIVPDLRFYRPRKDFGKIAPEDKVIFLEASGNSNNGAEVMHWYQHNINATSWGPWFYSFPHGPQGTYGASATFAAYDGHVGKVSRQLAGLNYLPADLPFDFGSQ